MSSCTVTMMRIPRDDSAMYLEGTGKCNKMSVRKVWVTLKEAELSKLRDGTEVFSVERSHWREPWTRISAKTKFPENILLSLPFDSFQVSRLFYLVRRSDDIMAIHTPIQ